MNSIKRLFVFLGSLWGTLAGLAVAFPGAAALLKLPLAPRESVVSTFYPILATIFSAIALLFLTAYRSPLSNLARARKTAIIFITVASLLVFSYLGIRVVRFEQDYLTIEYSRLHGEGSRIETTRKGSIIQITEYDGVNSTPVASRHYSDPFDIVCLALFSFSFAAFAASFGTLGIHIYATRERK